MLDGYYNSFTFSSADIAIGHTYSFIVTKQDYRTLFVAQVVDAVPNGELKIFYAVLDYMITQITDESPGFDWNVGNHW